MSLTHDAVLHALSTVQDPDLGRDLVTLGMVKDVQIDGSKVTVGIELTTPACPMKDRIQADIEQAIRSAAGSEKLDITVEFTAQVRAAKPSLFQLLSALRHHAMLLPTRNGATGPIMPASVHSAASPPMVAAAVHFASVTTAYPGKPRESCVSELTRCQRLTDWSPGEAQMVICAMVDKMSID